MVRRMSRDRPGATRHLLALVLLAGIMAALSIRLFSGMTTVGMSGVDTFEYWKYANEIIHDKREFVFNRLSFYAINVLALKVLGPNDYAIRATIGALAVLNVGLVYLLSYRLSASTLIALAVAALYAFNPVMLRYAETELPHITGATFVLLTFLFSLPVLDRRQGLNRRLACAFLAGVAIAGAVLTHEEIIFLAAGHCFAIALVLLTASDRPPDRAWSREFAPIAAALALGGAVGALWPMLATGVGPGKIVRDFFALRAAVDENTAIRTGGDFLKVVLARAITGFTVDSLGWILTVLAAALAVIVPMQYARRRTWALAAVLSIEIAIVFYIVAFLGIGRVYLEGSYQRLFIPMIGPTIAFTLASGFLIFNRRWLRGFALFVLVGVSSLMVWTYQPWVYYERVPTRHRALYDAAKALVTPDRRLLLPACFGLDASWVGIGSKVYLGDNVVPIYLMRQLVSFDELLAKEKIGFVLVPTNPLRGMWPLDQMQKLFSVTYGEPMTEAELKSLSQVSQDVWRGDTRVEWSREACAFESSTVRKLVEQHGGRPVASAPGVGDIFALDGAPKR